MDASASRHARNSLRQERIRRNWRQQDLADQVETTVATVRRWEQGRQQPSAYFRIKLCALFGKSAEELGLIAEEPQPQPQEKNMLAAISMSLESQTTSFSSRSSEYLDASIQPGENASDSHETTISAHQLPRPGRALTREQRDRMRMLKQVQRIWIDGLLTQSLHQATRIELRLQDRLDILANPWKLLYQELDHVPRPLPIGTSIIEVYDAADSELLIIGEPGAGKTTLLLELTHVLLEQAEKNEQLPMPIVFNLSSWAEKHQPLCLWLIEELQTKYQVPRNIGRSWIHDNQVLPLLDGLDEVTKEARNACVEQINIYYQSRRDHGNSPLVVCCRSEEYTALSTHLMLGHAISILPLTDEQVNIYLEQAGEQVKGLRQALNKDSELYSLIHQPLMLNLFTLAYNGVILAEVPTGETREETQHTVFDRYVERMLKRRRQSTCWKLEQMIGWLTFLAKQMQRHNQTVFSVENLQPTWLSRRRKHLCQCGAGLLGGLAGGLFSGLFGTDFGVLFDGIFYGVLGGVIALLLFGLDARINPAEAFIWSWEKALSGLLFGVFIGLFSGLSVELFGGHVGPQIWLVDGLVVGLFFGLDTRINPAKMLTWSWRKALSGLLIWLFFGQLVGPIVGLFFTLISGLIGGLIGGLVGGLVIGLLFGLFFGLSGRQLPERLSLHPNEGIWRSGKNGLISGLLIGLVGGLVGGIDTYILRNENLFFELSSEPIKKLLFGMLVGLFFGLVVGLFFGLDAFVKHFILRFFLSQQGDLPKDLIAFLDEAAEHLLLRKVGGSYIFVHRLLLDYFATLNETKSAENTSRTKIERREK